MRSPPAAFEEGGTGEMLRDWVGPCEEKGGRKSWSSERKLLTIEVRCIKAAPSMERWQKKMAQEDDHARNHLVSMSTINFVIIHQWFSY